MATLKGSFEMYDDTISYEITDDMKDKIFERLIKYYSKYGYSGEVIHQCDDAIIYAPDVLSDICDNIIEFKREVANDEY